MPLDGPFTYPSTSSGDSGVSRGFDAQELREIWRVSIPTNPTMPPQSSQLLHNDTLVMHRYVPREEPVMKVKCVIVGDGAVGKTSMVVSYTTNGYPTEYVPTAYDNYSVIVTVDNQPISLQLCDTAGQDDFDSLRPLCYPKTDIFLLCFSVVNPTSFNNITEKWLPEIQRHAPSAPIILVGTQSDLRNDIKIKMDLARYKEQPISATEAQALSRALGAVDYIECSALTQKNLKEVFDTAIIAVLDKHIKESYGKKKHKGSKKKAAKYTHMKEHDTFGTRLETVDDHWTVQKVEENHSKSRRHKKTWKHLCCFS